MSSVWCLALELQTQKVRDKLIYADHNKFYVESHLRLPTYCNYTTEEMYRSKKQPKTNVLRLLQPMTYYKLPWNK
jgi:hypothetical protein